MYNLNWGTEGVAAVEAQPAKNGALPFYGVIGIGPYSTLILSHDPA